MRKPPRLPASGRGCVSFLGLLLFAASGGCGEAPPARPADFCDDPLPPGGWFRVPAGGRGPAAAAFSPDSRVLATAARSGPIRLWDVPTGALLGGIEDSAGDVRALAFSPDGRRLVSSGHGEGGREIRVWDVASRARVSAWTAGASPPEALSFVPGSVRVAALRGGEILSWNLETGERAYAWKGRFSSFAISADGQLLAAAGSEGGAATVRLWREGFSKPRWTRPAGRVRHLWFVPGRRGVLLACDESGLRWLDTAGGAEMASRRIPGGASTAALSPDGRFVAVADGPSVRLVEAASGDTLDRFDDPGDPPASLAFSPDGRLLAVGSASGAVLVRDLGGGGPLDRLWATLAGPDAEAAQAAVADLVSEGEAGAALLRDRLAAPPAFSPGLSERIARLDASTPEERDAAAESVRRVGETAEPALRLALEGPGSEARSIRAKIPLRKLLRDAEKAESRGEPPSGETLRRIRALEALERIGTPGALAALEAAARGDPWTRVRREAETARARLAAAGAAPVGAAPSAAVPAGREALPEGVSARLDLKEIGVGERVSSLAASRDGGAIAVVGPGGGALLWEPGSGREPRSLDGADGDLSAVAISPDGGSIAAGNAEGRLFLFDAKTCAPRAPLDRCAGGVRAVAFSSDGGLLAAAGGQGMVRVYDLQGPAPPRRFADDEGACLSLAFLPGGSTLVAAWANGMTRIGPVGGRRPKTREAFPAAPLAALSPDGRLLAWARDASVCVQEAPAGRVLFESKPAGRPASLAFSPDGRILAAGCADGTVVFLEVATGKAAGAWAAASKEAPVLAFARNGRLVSAGGGRVLVRGGSGRAGDLEGLWSDLASPRAERARRAVEALASAPGAAAFLRERLRPGPIDGGRVEELLGDLTGSDAAARSRAASEILALGARAEPFLRAFLDSNPGEAAEGRARPLLESVRAGRASPPEGESLRRARAIWALERIGSAEALAALEEFARGGPELYLRDDARSSFLRIGRNSPPK